MTEDDHPSLLVQQLFQWHPSEHRWSNSILAFAMADEYHAQQKRIVQRRECTAVNVPQNIAGIGLAGLRATSAGNLLVFWLSACTPQPLHVLQLLTSLKNPSASHRAASHTAAGRLQNIIEQP